MRSKRKVARRGKSKTKRQAAMAAGVGRLARQLIRERRPTDEVVSRLKRRFPRAASASPQGVAWYRWDMRRHQAKRRRTA